MLALKEIKAVPTPYRGSENTAKMVRDQLRKKYNDQVANDYSPYFSCRTFREWRKIGYTIKKGEKAIKSIVVIEDIDTKGNVIRTYPKVINLFHLLQIERMKS